MRLGIYGGTFSPIHLGHVRAAEDFLNEFGLDKLLVIPTALPPHKAEVAGASAEDRLEMARLAFMGHDRIEVSDYEIARGGKSYSVLTLERFKPGSELFMLVGTDMFLTLDKWFRAGEIFRLADIVLKRREDDPDTAADIASKTIEYTERFGARIHIMDDAAFPVSSTELRELIRDGKPTDGLLPDSVADYISENHLYKEVAI